jgi:hypothetical protein
MNPTLILHRPPDALAEDRVPSFNRRAERVRRMRSLPSRCPAYRYGKPMPWWPPPVLRER